MNRPESTTEDPIIQRARARVGMVLQDKWHLDALIGIGGMAAVYAATHRNRKRVAVKVLHVDISGDSEIRQRFLREGYAANAIGHEGAVSVLDDDVAPDGAAFIVMELLEGETLEARWSRMGQRMPLAEVLAYTDELLDVLAAAHAREVVHRDIKPENLFLTRSGKLKVLDFGIARVLEARASRSLTLAGTVMGTPAYMAPEQARARWDEVDGRTDLWAVGATMFTLLTGQFVHPAETGNEQLILSATTPPRSIGSVVLGLPTAVVATIDRALAFDQDERWPDALSMQRAVRAAHAAVREASQSGSPVGIASLRVSKTPDSPMSAGQREAVTLIGAPSSREAAVHSTGDADATTDLVQLRASLQEAEQRATAAKRRTVEVEGRLAAIRAERKGLEDRFHKQLGTRTSAVVEAQHVYRSRAADVARRLVGDRSVCGAEFDVDREAIVRASRTSEARERDALLHAEAVTSFDPKALRQGLIVGAIYALLALALLIAPIIWRATLVVEPTLHVAPAPAPRSS